MVDACDQAAERADMARTEGVPHEDHGKGRGNPNCKAEGHCKDNNRHSVLAEHNQYENSDPYRVTD